MFKIAVKITGLALVALCASNVSAADEATTACVLNAEGMAPRVQAILGTHFKRDGKLQKLQNGRKELAILQTHSGRCSVVSRSHDPAIADRHRNISEWHSINLWIGRLMSSVDRSLRTDDAAAWRDEYALFAEVYEFTP